MKKSIKLKKNFKKLILLFLIMIIFFNITISYASNSDEIELVSKSAIIMDTNTGKVLYSKDENEKMYPASTTKIVTAILTLEHCDINDQITVSYDAVMSIPDGYSTAYLQIGENLTVEQLLELLLVHSANDAANVLAEHVGGSIDSFVSMMNTKVNELGLSNTHFTNTYGKHDDNHYTTASDLAKIMIYCIKNENFRKIAGKASCAIPTTNLYGTRKYNSTNELIVPTNTNYYEYLTCGKTGYTTQAGDCLVSCAYKDGLELVCVILGGKTVGNESTRFSETRKLYEYVFSNYQIKTLVNKEDILSSISIENATKKTKDLELLSDKTISALIKNSTTDEELNPTISLNQNIKAPINEGEILGTATYNVNGETYSTYLVASHSVEKSYFLAIIIASSLAILLILYVIMKSRNKSKKRRKK